LAALRALHFKPPTGKSVRYNSAEDNRRAVSVTRISAPQLNIRMWTDPVSGNVLGRAGQFNPARKQSEDRRHRKKGDPNHGCFKSKSQEANSRTPHAPPPVVGALEQQRRLHRDDGSDEARDGNDKDIGTGRTPPAQPHRAKERGQGRTDWVTKKVWIRLRWEVGPPFPVSGPG